MLHEQKHTTFTRKTQLFASEIKFASLNEIQLDCILAMLENIDIIPSVACTIASFQNQQQAGYKRQTKQKNRCIKHKKSE